MPRAPTPKGGRRSPFLLLVALLGAPSPLAAQAEKAPHQIRWYEPLIAAAGVSVFFLVDNPVRSYMLDNQTTGKDNAADFFRAIGEPQVWVVVPAAMVGTGLLAKKPGLTQAGLRAVSSAALAGGVTGVLKWVFGRERPDQPGSEPDIWEPFSFEFASGEASFPSGHTSAAFGFVASLAEDVDPWWAKVGLYALGVGTAWSRVYNNKHWTSDVVAGAIVGIGSAKLVSGRWRAWGIRTPSIFTDGHQVTVSWHGTF